MNETKPPPAPPRTVATTGYATASLVLGILSVLMSLFLVGGFLGFIGVFLGLHYLRRGAPPRTMAGWGVGLCMAGIVLTLGFSYGYYRGAKYLIEKTGSLASVDSGFSDWSGKPAPDLAMRTLDGATVQLSSLRGKKVVLDFWATWCPPCRMEIPHFIRLTEENSKDEFVIVGVSAEDEATLRTFAEKNHVNYTFAMADDLPEPYSKVTGIPTTFFIDRQGVIKNAVVGYHDYDTLKKEALSEDWTAPAAP